MDEEIIIPIAFFLFLMTCVIASAWKRKKIETIRHETARLLIEKNPAADFETFAQLLNPPIPVPATGTAFRVISLIGVIVVAVGIGLWLMGFLLPAEGSEVVWRELGGPATLVAVIGAGLLFAARFFPRSAGKDAEPSKSPGNALER
jgi:hypothetical protein